MEPRSPQLSDRHRVLLGLHARRRRLADAGAACTSSSSAIRRSRCRSCSCFMSSRASSPTLQAAGSRLASAFRACSRSGRPCRSPGLLMLSALDPGVDGCSLRRLGRRGARHLRARQGLHQDGVEVGDQGDVGEGSGQLFKWVAWFTGSKNAMKGLGFFVGGLLLDVVGFKPALWLMAALIGMVFVHGDRRCCHANSARRNPRSRCASFSQSHAASICWRQRASFCSVRAMSGSWSGCRYFSTPMAGDSLRSEHSWQPGRSPTAAVQAFAPIAGIAQRRRPQS